MSELAPKHEDLEELERTNQLFEVLKNSFEMNPEGPLFTAVWEHEVDIRELVARRHPTEAELKAEKAAEKRGEKYDGPRVKPVITTGLLLLSGIFQQTELMQSPEQLQEFKDVRQALVKTHETGSPETDHLVYEIVDRLIKVHESTTTLLNEAYKTYYSGEYWDDVAGRKGLRIERLELLHALTDAYEDQGILGTLKTIEDKHVFSKDIVSEANRIARILVAREVNAIE